MTPPNELADYELTYASELWAVYVDAENIPEMVREDLSNPSYRRFNCQRIYYYMAETILEASRDALKLKKSEGFDKEQYEAVIRKYPTLELLYATLKSSMRSCFPRVKKDLGNGLILWQKWLFQKSHRLRKE